jgi:hypothetical protein
MPGGPSDLAIVTTYFNPAGWRTRSSNYARFTDGMRRAGLAVVTVECAFGAAEFALPPSADVVPMRARDVLWQKERLINAAVARLPAQFTKVAWLDCDVLFEDSAWAHAASRLLDDVAFVQLFDRIVRLPRGHVSFSGEGHARPGFAARRTGDASPGGHGHVGYAWAARRDALRGRGLYDACIAGGADHVMAHAFGGEPRSPCIDEILGRDGARRRHFDDWCRALPRAAAKGVGFVPGALFHLWHGEAADRRYGARNRDLAALSFDPATDIRVGPSGCWEWASEKPELHRWTQDYFARRNEDG